VQKQKKTIKRRYIYKAQSQAVSPQGDMFLTPSEVVRELGVGEAALRRMEPRGELKPGAMGRKAVRHRLSHIEHYMARLVSP
jgi:hypothetical protein